MSPTAIADKLKQYFQKNNTKKALKHPFVVAVIAIYFVFILFAINGSSLGVYSGDPSDRISTERIGTPKPIRSDEWLVNTQLTVAQQKAGYPRYNNNVSSGQDMSVVLDVPYKGWSTLFKPQNILFLIIPFANAFAAKWWFSLVLLLLGTYFLSLKFMQGRKDAKLLASLLSLFVGFTPMLMWWYQSTTTASLSISYLLITAFIFCEVITESKVKTDTKTRLSRGLAVFYLLSCWTLLMYPPFQIANLIVFALFFLGYTLNNTPGINLKKFSSPKAKLKLIFRRIWPLLIGAIGAGIVFIIFIKTRYSIFETIQSTVYPGKRSILPGGYDLQKLLQGTYNYALQAPSKAAVLAQNNSNQSEFSTFGIWWILGLVTAPFIIFKNWQKSKNINWEAAAILSILIFFIIRISVSFGGKLFYSPTLLSLVPHNRLIIAFIPLTLLAILSWVKSDELPEIKPKLRIAISALVFGILFFAGLSLSSVAPGLLSKVKAESILVGLAGAFIFYHLLARNFKLALSALTIFTVLSSVTVNPLQIGMGKLNLNSPQSKTAQQTVNKLIGDDELAIESSDVIYESVLETLGKKSITGVYTYPKAELWSSFQQDDAENIYNRYAHVNYQISDQPVAELSYNRIDHFSIKGSVCSVSKVKFNNRKVTKMISAVPIQEDCAELIGDFPYLNTHFFVYNLNSSNTYNKIKDTDFEDIVE